MNRRGGERKEAGVLGHAGPIKQDSIINKRPRTNGGVNATGYETGKENYGGQAKLQSLRRKFVRTVAEG